MTENDMEKETQEEGQPETETTSVISKANEAAERIENATTALKLENDRNEAIAAQNLLGGKAQAGVIQKEIEETPEEYVKKVMSGNYGQ